ncbi:MAG: hypothetical protein KDK55_01890 [Chlamydiia bacterium]|nr:hypothetical protein [Chlamydiia bacterium]
MQAQSPTSSGSPPSYPFSSFDVDKKIAVKVLSSSPIIDLPRTRPASKKTNQMCRIVAANVGRLFLAIMGIGGIVVAVMAACHFHLPFWTVYAGGGISSGGFSFLVLSVIPWRRCCVCFKDRSRDPLFTDDKEWTRGIRPNLYPDRGENRGEKEKLETSFNRKKKRDESDEECLLSLRGRSVPTAESTKNQFFDQMFDYCDLKTQVILLSLKREGCFGTRDEEAFYRGKCQELGITVPDGVSPKERYKEARGFLHNVRIVKPVITEIDKRDAIFPSSDPDYEWFSAQDEQPQAIDGEDLLYLREQGLFKTFEIVNEDDDPIYSRAATQSTKNWTCGDLRSKILIAGRQDGVVEIIDRINNISVCCIKIGKTPIRSVSLRGHLLTIDIGRTDDKVICYDYMPRRRG